MKLTSIIADPTLAGSSKSSYQYEILINGKKKICKSHVETVITVLKMLSDEKIINLSDIEESERMAGYMLILDVSDIKADTEIAKVINSQFPKYKNRYNCKNLLTNDKSKYIVCREWTVPRVDSFIEKFMSIANSGKTKKSELSSVTRL